MRNTLVTHQLPINNLTTMTNTKKKKIKHIFFNKYYSLKRLFFFFQNPNISMLLLGYMNINSKIEFLTSVL